MTRRFAFHTIGIPRKTADALYEAQRFEFRKRPGAVVTTVSLNVGGGCSLTFHRFADLPWNSRRKPKISESVRPRRP